MTMNDLKQQKRWIVWRYETGKGKKTKVPYSAHGTATGTNPPYAHSWVTYDEAAKSAQEHGYDGVGFIIPKGCFFLDIDHKDINDPYVQMMLERFGSYAEYSVSGGGIHIYGLCDINRIPTRIEEKTGKLKLDGAFYQKNPNNNTELYMGGITNRFAVYTGNVIRDEPLKECTDAMLVTLDKNMRRTEKKRYSEKRDGGDEGKVVTIIVKDMSRLGRDYLKVGMYTEMVFPNADVRFIAINNGVDSANQAENDMTPFINIFNEFYAKDTSRKIRAVFKSKGQAGKPLCTNPPYGYVKDPEDRLRWIVDEEAAEHVREVFRLCVQGYGVSQIAAEMSRRHVLNPTAYAKAHGRGISDNRSIVDDYVWADSTISHMLSRLEYLGHTVNFKTYRKSYKQKKQLKHDPSEWQVFEHTHEAIIDQETFDIVQRIRDGRRRWTPMGEMPILSGMLFCADCGAKLYQVRHRGWEHEQEHFVCATYRKVKGGCSSHQIRNVVVEDLLLDGIRRMTAYAREHEAEFVEMVTRRKRAEVDRSLRDGKRELEQVQIRIRKLDEIIQRLYEDNVEGKISDERFVKLSENYENEQKTLEGRVTELRGMIASEQEANVNVDRFLSLVRKYTDIQELTAEIIQEFVEKIYVHKAERIDGKRVQRIRIVWNCIGELTLPTSEQEEKTA